MKTSCVQRGKIVCMCIYIPSHFVSRRFQTMRHGLSSHQKKEQLRNLHMLFPDDRPMCSASINVHGREINFPQISWEPRRPLMAIRQRMARSLCKKLGTLAAHVALLNISISLLSVVSHQQCSIWVPRFQRQVCLLLWNIVLFYCWPFHILLQITCWCVTSRTNQCKECTFGSDARDETKAKSKKKRVCVTRWLMSVKFQGSGLKREKHVFHTTWQKHEGCYCHFG